MRRASRFQGSITRLIPSSTQTAAVCPKKRRLFGRSFPCLEAFLLQFLLLLLQKGLYSLSFLCYNSYICPCALSGESALFQRGISVAPHTALRRIEKTEETTHDFEGQKGGSH